MGNSVPRIPVPVDQIQLIPGNVLIYVDEKKTNEAQSLSRGDGGTYYHNLIRGRVVHVGPTAYPSGTAGYPERTVPNLKPGDEVWVRARKGYPIETGDGHRLFVFNEWDVAIKFSAGPRASRSAGNGISSGGYLPNSPPPYEEKPRMN